jgi:hypothetical protein
LRPWQRRGHYNPKIRPLSYNSLIWQFGTVNFISYIFFGYSLRQKAI